MKDFWETKELYKKIKSEIVICKFEYEPKYFFFDFNVVKIHTH